jgi:predicted dehydrogenase
MNPITKLRWGILSTARIGRRNWRAMLASEAATLVAVASRDVEKAAEFIREMQLKAPWPICPEASCYEDLLANPAVDAVYIPLPTGLRKEWVMRAAQAGKHVLCEKPCAVRAEDLREMIDCCERHGVRFMDGVMFMHDPRFAVLRDMLDGAQEIGELRRITSAFSFLGDAEFMDSNIRGCVALEPTGCLGDLGWYCLRATLWAMRWELPQRVSGRILASVPDRDACPAISDFTGDMEFSGGASANFHCSFLASNQQWLNVSGAAGSLRVPDFVSPAADHSLAWELGYQPVARSAVAGISNEARMFACFAAELTDASLVTEWAEISWKTQLLLDACEKSARLERPLFLRDGVYSA